MPLFLQRPAAGEYNPYYEKYIARVPEGDLIELLARHADETIALLRHQPPDVADYAYAAGKWTVKQVVGHVCDAERIFSYRLLRVGRGDQTPLASFDENVYAPAGRFELRTLESLLEEFAAVRQSTIALVAGLPDEAWSFSGVASENPISARPGLHHRRPRAASPRHPARPLFRGYAGRVLTKIRLFASCNTDRQTTRHGRQPQ